MGTFSFSEDLPKVEESNTSKVETSPSKSISIRAGIHRHDSFADEANNPYTLYHFNGNRQL